MEADARPGGGIELPVVLNAGIGAGDLTLTCDPSVYGKATVKAPSGTVVVANAEQPGTVHLSAVRTDASETATVRVLLTEVNIPSEPGSGLRRFQISGRVFDLNGRSMGEVMQILERRQTAALGAYPNPFNPATTLRYELPEAGEVRLTVYNAVGQAVHELVSGWQAAGGYAIVRWRRGCMSCAWRPWGDFRTGR